MKTFLKDSALVFSAGSLGAFINSLVLWGMADSGVLSWMGVHLHPSLTPAWLYPRLVWGGLWGFLFLLPLVKQSAFKEGVLLSLAPTLVQLFIVFPLQSHDGLMGLRLGLLTPLIVFIVNAVWGLTAAYFLKITR